MIINPWHMCIYLNICLHQIYIYSAILDTIDTIYDEKKDPEILGLRTMMTDNKLIAAATVLGDMHKSVVLFSDYLQGDIYFSRVNTKQKVFNKISD